MEEAMFEHQIEKIRSKNVVFAIMGMGYVGLPLAVAAAEAGIRVIGYDVSQEKVNHLLNLNSYIEDIPKKRLKTLIASGSLFPTTDDSYLEEADVISICVPTPLGKMHEPDISCIKSAVETIKKHLHKGQLIILESTTYPGTTREVVMKAVEEKEFQTGKDVFVAFSPERVDPGNKQFTIENTVKIVGGATPDCTALAATFYRLFIKDVYEVSSPEVAEMSKLLENIFRAVNIALVNELMLLCDRMGISVWEVIEAAATKPFGFMKFLPGPGLGGHCIPVDPFYLSWKARQYDFWTEFIELSGRVSENIPYFVVEKAYKTLNEHGKCLKNATILILGLSYKKDVGDTRHSPALKIISILKQEGANIKVNDPYVEGREPELEGIEKVELTEEIVREADLVLLITDHGAYDYQWIAENAKLIIDTRNAFKNIAESLKGKIKLI